MGGLSELLRMNAQIQIKPWLLPVASVCYRKKSSMTLGLAMSFSLSLPPQLVILNHKPEPTCVHTSKGSSACPLCLRSLNFRHLQKCVGMPRSLGAGSDVQDVKYDSFAKSKPCGCSTARQSGCIYQTCILRHLTPRCVLLVPQPTYKCKTSQKCYIIFAGAV